MKRTLSVAAALCIGLLIAPSVPAEVCTLDPLPAASLLAPYFEVNLKRRDSNTLISINNASAAAAITQVTLWTNWAVPTLTFNVFLTGYDIETIDLRRLFNDGFLPQTAHAANDPDDTISPHGTNPSWDPTFTSSCDPLLPPAPLGPQALERLRNAHTGRDTGEGCVGADLGDQIARGYVTIDNTNDCSLLYPGEPGYFGSGGVASTTNQLWGQFFFTSQGKGFSAGSLVPIEAQAGFAGRATGYTFYGRLVGGTGDDAREPLGTTWAARYLDRNLQLGRPSRPVDTDFVIWRDPKVGLVTDPIECGSEPNWYPLQETQVVAFSEQEDVVEICFGFGDDPDPACAPLATQLVRVNRRDLATPYNAGWMYWNLNHDLAPEVADAVDFEGLAQSYVASLLSVRKLRSGLPAAFLSSACGDSFLTSGRAARKAKRKARRRDRRERPLALKPADG